MQRSARHLFVGGAIILMASGLPASNASREPAHAPDHSREFQYPPPSGMVTRAVVLSENFDGAWPPAGWTVVDNEAGGSATTWNLNTTFSSYNGNFTNGSGTCAMACSDCSSGEFDVELRSPVVDCSGTNTVTLTFTANYQNYSNSDFFEVDVSNDGGSTWTNVLTWNEDHGAFDATPGEDVALDISSVAAGQSQVMVRFHYYDPNSSDWDWYVQVDDVQVDAAVSRAGIPTLSRSGVVIMLLALTTAAILVIRRRF